MIGIDDVPNRARPVPNGLGEPGVYTRIRIHGSIDRVLDAPISTIELVDQKRDVPPYGVGAAEFACCAA
jgi:hypothetical protein